MSGIIFLQLTLKRLKEQVPEDTYETWLKDTVLLQVTDIAAQIAVPNAFAVVWLERRMYGQICEAMKMVTCTICHRWCQLRFYVASKAKEQVGS
jgi:chromosomal replication initiation ATPase DnaA